MSSVIKSRRVNILAKKRGFPDSIVSIDCVYSDMVSYVDMLRVLYDNDDVDYLVIEPVLWPNSLF